MTSPFTHEPRKRFTPRERAEVFALRLGCCHRCTRKLSVSDDWTLEHRIALECGGTNSTENMDVTCSWCEPTKTAEDHRAAGHNRRAYTRHVVPGRFRKGKGWG